MNNAKHELIQSNYGLPFKVFTFRGIDSGQKIPLHWHNHIEILFCLEGSLALVISGHSYLLQKHDVVLINTNAIHASFSPTINHVLCIQLPLNWLCDQVGLGYSKTWLFKLNNSIVGVRQDCALVNKLLKIAKITETSHHHLSEKLELQGQLFLLLKLLINYTSPIDKETAKDPSFLFGSEMVNFINQNFQTNLSLTDVSHHLGYSNEYCSRNFKKILGINFKELLTSTRLNYAYDKIINTDQQLEEIARSAGFSTYRNMYNSFIKSYHVSPSKLRTQQQN
jgi:AraC-like DNA-binding protein